MNEIDAVVRRLQELSVNIIHAERGYALLLGAIDALRDNEDFSVHIPEVMPAIVVAGILLGYFASKRGVVLSDSELEAHASIMAI